MWRRQVVVEKVIVPVLRALKQPREQMWLGIALATLLAALFAFGGGGSSAPAVGSSPAVGTNPTAPHPTLHSGPFAIFKAGPKKLHPGSRPLDAGTLPDEPSNVPQDDFGVIH